MLPYITETYNEIKQIVNQKIKTQPLLIVAYTFDELMIKEAEIIQTILHNKLDNILNTVIKLFKDYNRLIKIKNNGNAKIYLKFLTIND